MLVTLIVNYFVDHKIKTEIKVIDLNQALLYVATLKSQGYEILPCHYGIYEGDLHSSRSRGPAEDISHRYALPVIQKPIKEPVKAWNYFLDVLQIKFKS